MNITDFISRFPDAKFTGGQYMAHCPAHADDKASLAVKESESGSILLKCHAGCETEKILQVMGLKFADLMPEQSKPERMTESCIYYYRDAAGQLLFQTVRYVPKTFRQRRPDPSAPGSWIWNIEGIKPVLYRLPELLASDKSEIVFITEGEKATDKLRSYGLIATNSPMGAGKWRPEYAQELKGRRVVVLPDNDDPGRKHAELVAKSLEGVAGGFAVLALPGLKEKGDVFDWVTDGGPGNPKELVRLGRLALESVQGDDCPIIFGSEMEVKPLEWLWKGRLLRGKLHTFAGHGGIGKSLVLLDIAARISLGCEWPFPYSGEPNADKGATLFISGEDAADDTLLPRFLEMGGDREQICFLKHKELVKYQLYDTDILDKCLESAKKAGRTVRLLVIDPPTGFMRGIDDHKNSELRSVLDPLAIWAANTGVTVIFNTHLNKGSSSGAAESLLRVMGGMAWVNAPRASHAFVEVPDCPIDDRKFMFLPLKVNLSEMRRGLSYQIVKGSTYDVGTVRWLGEVSIRTNEAMNGKAEKPTHEGSNGTTANRCSRGPAADRAAEWLAQTLRERGEIDRDTLFAEAKTVGHSQSSMYAAKNAIGVKSKNVYVGEQASCVWYINDAWESVGE